MDSFEEYIEEKRQREQLEYEEFMKTCKDKITDGDVIYRALALFIAQRFKLEIPSYGDVDNSVYFILNHYVEEVNENFEEWLNKEDAPLIRSRKELRKIFPEFNFIKSDKKLVETVNKVYKLDLDLTDECIYSLSFDFNSFTPINVDEIHRIKEEIRILKKYGHSTEELEKKLDEFDLESEIMEVI